MNHIVLTLLFTRFYIETVSNIILPVRYTLFICTPPTKFKLDRTKGVYFTFNSWLLSKYQDPVTAIIHLSQTGTYLLSIYHLTGP